MSVIAGPADGPAIVFLHGTRLSAGMWAAQQAALSGTFRTIAMDLPGHASRAGDPFTLEGAVDAVAAAIRDESADGRAIVVGLSLGGYVAMAVAAREPDRVRGLVLSGATIEPAGLLSLPYRAFAEVLDRAAGERFARFNARSFRLRYPPAIADPIIAGGFWPHGGAAALRTIAAERFRPRLAAYPGRTLILNGDLDLPFRIGAPAFAAAAHDARRVRLAGASHLANLDRPAAFSEAVRRFAASVDTD
jgi:pimeloyl-ACP methyl ester carboxylesterase